MYYYRNKCWCWFFLSMELIMVGVREKPYLSHGTVGCLLGRALLNELGQSWAQIGHGKVEMSKVGKVAALCSDNEDYKMKVAEAQMRYKQYKAKCN